jgi:hypothetical protein
MYTHPSFQPLAAQPTEEPMITNTAYIDFGNFHLVVIMLLWQGYPAYLTHLFCSDAVILGVFLTEYL